MELETTDSQNALCCHENPRRICLCPQAADFPQDSQKDAFLCPWLRDCCSCFQLSHICCLITGINQRDTLLKGDLSCSLAALYIFWDSIREALRYSLFKRRPNLSPTSHDAAGHQVLCELRLNLSPVWVLWSCKTEELVTKTKKQKIIYWKLKLLTSIFTRLSLNLDLIRIRIRIMMSWDKCGREESWVEKRGEKRERWGGRETPGTVVSHHI